MALSGSSTRLTTPPSDSSTYCLCTSLTTTPGATSALILIACAGFPSVARIATLSAALPETTTPFSWKLLATATVDRPPNKPAAASGGGADCTA
jgi:hypothetical protein